MTTEVERLLPLVDQFLKAKPEGVTDDDWHDAAIYAVIAGRITDKTTPWVFAESWVNKAKSTFVDVVIHMRGKASG